MIAKRVTRALWIALFAVQATACATRIFTDAANGVRHDLAVRAIAKLDAAYVAAPPEGGLVLCGDVAVAPLHLAALGTRDAERRSDFAAYLSLAKLVSEDPTLGHTSFYARYGAECSCLAKVEGLRALPVAPAAGEAGVTLVDPPGIALRDVTLEQQVLHVDPLPGLTLRPVDVRLGPRGGNPAYWALLPFGLIWDGTFLVTSVAVGAPLYALSYGVRSVASVVSPATEAPKPEPARDPCAGIAGWYAPGGPH